MKSFSFPFRGSQSATAFRRRRQLPSKGARRRLSEQILPVSGSGKQCVRYLIFKGSFSFSSQNLVINLFKQKQPFFVSYICWYSVTRLLHPSPLSPPSSSSLVQVRRSKREKRLIFSNFNQQEINRQLLNPNAFPVIEEFSEVSPSTSHPLPSHPLHPHSHTHTHTLS